MDKNVYGGRPCWEVLCVLVEGIFGEGGLFLFINTETERNFVFVFWQ